MSASDPESTAAADAGDPETATTRPGSRIPGTDARSPRTPYYMRAGALIALALIALVFVLAGLRPIGQTDLWAHLKFGQWIVDNQSLPDHEPFTPFADRQAAYPNLQWLTQAGWYLLYGTGEWLAGGDEMQAAEGGVEMLRLAQAVLAALRCAVLLLAFRRLTGSVGLACVGVGLCLLADLDQLADLRPQAVGEFFFACLLLALARAVLSRRALLLVPLVLVLWANTHGSFLIGLVLLAVSLGGRIIEAGRDSGGWDWRRARQDAQVRRLAGVLAGSAAAVALLNPHGIFLYAYTFEVVGNPNLHSLAGWQPMEIHLGPGGHWYYLASLLLLAGSQALSPRTLAPGQLLLLLTFGVWPLMQERMIVWWWLVLPWLVLPLWSALDARLAWSWLHVQSVASLSKSIVAGLVVMTALAWSAPVQWLLAGRPRPLTAAVSAGTPWRVAAQLRTSDGTEAPWLPKLTRELRQCGYPQGRFRGRIFSSQTPGDYLVWALAPEFPVLVYSHAHLFPADFWTDMMTARFGEPGWWDVLDRYGANLVVVEAEPPVGGEGTSLAEHLRKDSAWQVVLDEGGDPAKRDPRTRLLVALRKRPKMLAGGGEVRTQRPRRRGASALGGEREAASGGSPRWVSVSKK